MLLVKGYFISSFFVADLAAQCQGESKTNMPESISSSHGLQDAKEVDQQFSEVLHVVEYILQSLPSGRYL